MLENILVTGSAGFIGFHVCINLIKKGFNVIGLDNLNDYYDVKLKKARLDEIFQFLKRKELSSFTFIKCDLEDKNNLDLIFKEHKPKKVINLAAQAGVRYSINNPSKYINSNLVGFANLLEMCRSYEVEHFLYASSSSVYGGNKKLPFSENDFVDSPVSLYAATKKANELMAHAYSNLFNIPSTGIRLFTVYGPWGRPDMAPMLFTKAILTSKPIKIFNNGDMYRDFTYIDDVTDAIIKLLFIPPLSHSDKRDLDTSEIKITTPYRVINIGNSTSIKLIEFVETLENELEKKSIKIFEKMQLGDLKKTYADITYLKNLINYEPQTSIKKGIRNFVKWYKSYYKF
tara:strand:- start:358 stop:1389 length:1032 start_codon:yes stop_codon:yes gene_type:complete